MIINGKSNKVTLHWIHFLYY